MSEIQAIWCIVAGMILMALGYAGLQLQARIEGRVPRNRWIAAPKKAPRPAMNWTLLAVGMARKRI